MGTPIHERGYTSVPIPFVLQYPANTLGKENTYRRKIWRVCLHHLKDSNILNQAIIFSRGGTNYQGSKETP